MAKKKAAKKAPRASTALANIEKLVREGFQQVDRHFGQVDRHFEQVDRRLDLLDLGQRDLRSEMNEKLALIDERINLLANHVDGFIKLHETLDIEFKVMKEQMSRLEARLNRLEAERTT
jgi:regulator of replication initiation timing